MALQERTTVQDFHACCFIGKSYNLLVELIPYFICNIYQGREMLKSLPVWNLYLFYIEQRFLHYNELKVTKSNWMISLQKLKIPATLFTITSSAIKFKFSLWMFFFLNSKLFLKWKVLDLSVLIPEGPLIVGKVLYF